MNEDKVKDLVQEYMAEPEEMSDDDIIEIIGVAGEWLRSHRTFLDQLPKTQAQLDEDIKQLDRAHDVLVLSLRL